MFILINLKAYDCDPRSIATAIETVAPETSARLAVAPQAPHIAAVASVDVETWSQTVSSVGTGSHTGSLTAAAIADVGATGTLINHSECRRRLADIDAAIIHARSAGLETIVCGNNASQVGAAAALGPTAVAVEPPELIGTGTPVSKAEPELIREAVEAVNEIDPSVDVLCGAGITSGEDIKAASELGTDGVLLASGVAKADDPAAAIRSLTDPLS